MENKDFTTLDELNDKTHDWIESEYNNQQHSTIQMKPIDRFILDHSRLIFIQDDEFTKEVFFIEENRKVSKTNVFSIKSYKYECPVDLRNKTVQVRFNRSACDKFIVYFKDKRMGEAAKLNLHINAQLRIKGGTS